MTTLTLPRVSRSPWGEHPIGPLRTPDQFGMAYKPTPGPTQVYLQRQGKKNVLALDEFRRLEHLALLEKYLQEDLRQSLIRFGLIAHGWLYYHTHQSSNSPSGYPDTHICGNGRSLFVELKREAEPVVSDFQKWWLEALAKAGHEVYVLRPSGLAVFLEALT